MNHYFRFSLPTNNNGIKKVNLTGSFNNWDRYRNPMNYNPEIKAWELTLDLWEGFYPYKFLVNDIDWYHDLMAKRFEQNEVGSLNSIAVVSQKEITHASFRPLSPTADDEITICSDRPAQLMWSLNGWIPHPKGFLRKTVQDLAINIYGMKKNDKTGLYEYTIGPFNYGRVPEAIAYCFIFDDATMDDNYGRNYYLPINLQLGGESHIISFESKSLKRNSPFRYYLPKGYDKTKKDYPIVYLIHGYGGTHFADWTQADIIRMVADKKGLILVWPDGNVWVRGESIPSWYINSPAFEEAQMEDYIIKELIPYMEQNFNAAPTREKRAVAGISMGGFGSFYLGSKYHDYFKVAASMSAIYNLQRYKRLDALKKLVGDENWKGRNFNVLKLIRKAKDSTFWFIVGDEEKSAFRDNFLLKLKMDQAGIKNKFQILPGNHSNNFWRVHVQEMMEFISENLGL